ncbi:SusC/RagA family TonB-linked outer membrane protein [Psychroflexus planctonicus]|uniref:SusC/RagA family TonB-linked outer membrane protein n=1 Tax=Psychroflexus planctonicus TaxID=1526575 RepID=A0ABQ1SGY3_9FLAO|nr:SusC/RagA family TonB-linked outer membrane protein [Psychroflexus planctonicus]
MSTSAAIAQVNVTGKVTNKDNVPIPGVNVLIKDSTKGTETDYDGLFTLEAEIGSILVFKYLGLKTQEVEVTGEEELTIKLIDDIDSLDEVVVVGYGKRSKAKLIASVSTIDDKTLKKLPVPQVSNALEGLASGLFVRQTSGEPGFSASSFEIRNFGNALVIVDGAPGDLNQLDPNEIEDISILKDAAAASVYGVQGGNGVVLITTRKGNVGKPKLTYSNQFTYSTFTSYPDFFTSAQYAEVLNEGLRNANQNPFYTDAEIDLFRTGADPINYPDTDWKDLVLDDWGFQQRHNLNLAGGTESVKYFVSGGFLEQGSNYSADVLSFQQFNLRGNLNADVTDNLNLTLNLAARRGTREAPAYSAYDIFRELSRALPVDLAYYPDGTPARPSFSPNHIQEGLRDFNAGYYRSTNNNIDAKLTLQWDVNQIEGLSLKAYSSLVYDTSFNKDWGKGYELFTLNRETGEYDSFTALPEGAFSETILELSTNYSNHYVLRPSINYDRSFGNHSVSGLLLAEIQKIQGENFSGRRQDFQSSAIDQLYAGSLQNQVAEGGEFRENRLGYVGRFSYDFNAKYFIESSFRYDGSSRFAPGNEWGFFPSVSAGWRISEESFFEPIKDSFSELKLRGSIGTAGNDNTAAYQWLSGFNYNFFYVIGDGTIPTIDNTALANRDITWETITTYNVGLDARFLEGDLQFSFDYFFRKREDVLAFASSSNPSTLGVSLAAENLYEFSNEGFEFSINYNKKVNDNLRLNGLLNFSRSREKAVFIDENFQEDPFMRQNLTITGGFTNLRRGYISQGLFQSQEEIDQWAIQDENGNTSLQPGDVRYRDLNGDGIIDVQDQKVFGDGDKPAINYSLNLGVEYKRWALSVLLTGAAGYDIYIDGEAQNPLVNGFNGYDYQLDYWTPQNTNSAYPRITNGGANPNNNRYSDFWMRDGNHLRIRNVNLSYTIPSVAEKIGVNELSIFCTGTNLHVFKKYDEDFDPQNTSSVGWYYPQNKSFTFGVNLTF